MNAGRIAISMMLLAAVLTGIMVWYMTVYGYYDDVDEITGTQSLMITTADGTEPLPVSDFRGIDKTSSPLGWRACFTLDAPPADALPYEGATPLIGPNWFRCYSARGIIGDLESGAAHAVLSQKNIRHGVDRVIAIYPDGRAFGWHQLNGEAEEQRLIE